MNLHEQLRPENARKITVKGGLATFYTYTNGRGQPCVMILKGRSRKAKQFWFRSDARRSEYIAQQVQSILARKSAAEERRAARNKPHNLETGIILYTNWGYDQTNVEFYEVIDVPSKCYVILQEIGAPLVRGEESFMSGNKFPDPELKMGEPIRRKVDMSGTRPSVRINSVVTAWIWDGQEKLSSWYA
ncbi:hypothetical protein [uncultured Tateyamaria sp.]|uniref:hypothetical protein n=1 Tax=Tateyamaria sp. 1078 TaxID=3417464 RepID=UPI0026185F1E|nr:hypothetical protein [uncultured Tateyamaria sp.]